LADANLTDDERVEAQRRAYELALARNGGAEPPYNPDAAASDFRKAAGVVISLRSTGAAAQPVSEASRTIWSIYAGLSRTYRILIAAAAIVAALVGAITLFDAGIAVVNAGMQSRVRETKRVADDAQSGEPRMVACIQINSVDESTMTLQGQLFFHTSDAAVQDALEKQGGKMPLMLTDAYSSTIHQKIAQFRNRRFGYGTFNFDVKSEPIPIALSTASTSVSYPFDLAEAQLELLFESAGNLNFVPAFEVERACAGRKLDAVKWGSGAIKISLARTWDEKMFVCAASVLFLMTCLTLCIVLLRNRGHLSGVQEALAMASFLIATVGFRQFLGLDRFFVRPILDIVLFLPSLAVMAAIFCIHIVPKRSII
jgi:hypothetical protein